MSRKSDGPGTRASDVEVTNVSKHGFWLLIRDQERFVPFSEFPWFESATIAELTNVELAGTSHLRWPALDIDLSVESIDRPADYPLISKADLTR